MLVLSQRLALTVLVVVTLAGCSSWGKKPDPTKGWTAQQLYAAANEKLESGDFETAIDYFEKLESRYPFGVLAQQAQLEIAYAYYKYDEPDSAVAAAERFIKLHPQHSSVDYAYYLKGLTNFNRGRGLLDRFIPKDQSQRDPSAALDAFRDFEEVTSRFPASKYAPDAAQRMVFLKNSLAAHELHVSRYYIRRGAYVAAANRAKHVVENYQETPSVPEALVLMTEIYKTMGLDDASQDALRVLKLNFPDYPGIAALERQQSE